MTTRVAHQRHPHVCDVHPSTSPCVCQEPTRDRATWHHVRVRQAVPLPEVRWVCFTQHAGHRIAPSIRRAIAPNAWPDFWAACPAGLDFGTGPLEDLLLARDRRVLGIQALDHRNALVNAHNADRQRIFRDRQAIEEGLVRARDPARLIEPIREQIFFASGALSAFREGDATRKREVIATVTSNLTLTDRMLRVEAKKLFALLCNRDQFPSKCRRWESNPHEQSPHDFESCASTNSATTA